MVTKSKLSFFVICLLRIIYPLSTYSQIYIDNQIKMIGSSSSDRTIENLSRPADSLDIVNIYSFRSGSTVYGTAIGNDSLTVSIVPFIGSYKDGMTINFKTTSSNSGSVSLRINNLAYFPLVLNSKSLSPGILKAAQVVSAVFLNNNFHIISRTDPNCPTGFIEANSRYCIESDERQGTSFSNAVNICYNLNARLCNWGEWYYACQKTSLGLSNMTNNWEYLDDTSDHTHTVTVAGYPDCAKTMGLGTIGLTSPYTFRCCFSK